MLGTYLRLERTRLGYSTSDVSRRLGLSDTYFRLAEAGRAALNQSLVFKIIGVFAASTTPTHDSRTISFDRFALFTVGAHWVGAEMASAGAQDTAPKRAFEGLAALVGDFQVLFERTKKYFDLDEGSTEQKRFLEEVAAPEVGEFLTSDAYGTPAGAERDFLSIADLPTLNIEILLDLKLSLAGRSFVHTAEIAAKWESERASQFRYHRGLFNSAGLIVSPSNLDIFHFEYLAQKRFAESQMIFVEAQESEGATERRFIELLNKGRFKAGLEPATDEECEKVNLVCLSADERQDYKSEIEDLLRRDFNDHQAYWGFETHAGLPISFVGVSSGNAENIRNLSLRDAEVKAAEFTTLWNLVNASRTN